MKKLYVISNSHIDPVWLWDKYEGIDEVINTFRSVCHRLEEFPELYFSGSSISFYQWVKKFDPSLFEKIKKYVADGRWEVVGGWLVENDCNLPLSASFINSARISKEFMTDELNTSTEVAYSVDTFGHPASMPSILTETGFKYYVFCRPGEHEKKDLPSNLFYWEHNGNKVLAYRLKYHYSSGANCTKELIKSHILDESFYINDTACYFFGCGDHGGGPTIQEIKYIKELKEELKDTIDIQFSRCDTFFKDMEKFDIPTYSGDLHFHAIGCYSVNRDIKDGIRKSERALDYTQRIYDNLGKKIDLSDLWAKVSFNEFHDIMPGSCSPEAARQSVNELGGVQDSADMYCYEALKTVSGNMPLTCPQGEFRIYNSLPYEVTTPLTIESSMYYKPGMPFKKQDGTEILKQEIQSTTSFNRKMIFFDTIPAKSMASYYFDCNSDNAFNIEESQILWDEGVETEGNSVKIDKDLNIYKNGKKFFKTPVRLAVLRDSTDTWSHGIPGFNEGVEGYFTFVSSSVHCGPIYNAILTKWKYNDSVAEIEFDVYNNKPFIDMKVLVNMCEDFKVLKLIFEDTEKIEKHIVQGPGASIEKITNHCEEPLHTWIKFNDKSILQKGAFAYSRDNDKISFTLIRSSLYGWHDPNRINLNAPLYHTDRGEHRFEFRIFTEKLSVAETEKQSQIFVEPFKVMRENN